MLHLNTKPYEHQLAAVKAQRATERSFFAYLMEQGTGKTLTTLVDAWGLHRRGLINALLIVAPKSVVSTWTKKEIPTHYRGDYVIGKLSGGYVRKADKQRLDFLVQGGPRKNFESLHILVCNYEVLRSQRFFDLAAAFLKRNQAMMVLDESSHIKNHKSLQSKACQRLSGLAKHRRILTGTPVTHSPLDVFSQFNFLEFGCLGFSSFWPFRGFYSTTVKVTMGMRSFEKVTGFVNLKDLSDRVSAHSFRVTKKECLDLPPKVYSVREVELTKEQRKAYDDLYGTAMTELSSTGGGTVTVTSAIALIVKLQEITSGFIKDDDDNIQRIPSGKINELASIIQESDEKFLIWCAFREDVRVVQEFLAETYDAASVVTFTSGESTQQRDDAVDRIQSDPGTRFFVATSAASKGLTLTEATTSVYFSNSYNLETRLQSEDRNHRIGQTNRVLYVDLVCPETLDPSILANLRGKKDLADMTLSQLKTFIKP
jgi:SNF2 family DNA or RNA helicase